MRVVVRSAHRSSNFWWQNQPKTVDLWTAPHFLSLDWSSSWVFHTEPSDRWGLCTAEPIGPHGAVITSTRTSGGNKRTAKVLLELCNNEPSVLMRKWWIAEIYSSWFPDDLCVSVLMWLPAQVIIWHEGLICVVSKQSHSVPSESFIRSVDVSKQQSDASRHVDPLRLLYWWGRAPSERLNISPLSACWWLEARDDLTRKRLCCKLSHSGSRFI